VSAAPLARAGALLPHRLALAALAALAIGCERTPDTPGTPGAAGPNRPAATLAAPAAADLTPHPDAPAGIDWHAGSVESAFARAAAERQPIFLFWGAVWCPYCADLKAHVLARRDVQDRLKLFVPVYLDGDDPGAQKWAERLGVSGYPTVLALAPDGTELARIAGGMELDVYADMLDLVLADVRPIGELLDGVASMDGTLSREACRRLAYNGWGLEEPAAGPARMAELLDAAAERCPADAREERARLVAIATSYAVEAERSAGASRAPGTARLERLVGEVRALVADRALAAGTVDALQYLGADFFAAARQLASAEDRARLVADWAAVMRAAAADARFTEGDRLLAMRSVLTAVRELGGAPPTPELEAEARALVDAALARTAGTPASAGAVNAAVNVLLALEDLERAYEIAEAAMHTSRTPYYHMADLALLEERMGRTDAALEWLERAYRESAGAATRFQWGTNYVRGLIRLRPDDEAAIRAAAIAVLGELDGPDRLYRRTAGRLATLDAALRDWAAAGERAAAIRARMAEICDGIPAEEADALAACRGFLAG